MAERIQPWWCEKCNRASTTEFAEGAGVMEVLNQIFVDHERLSADCSADWGREYIRVVNPAFVKGS